MSSWCSSKVLVVEYAHLHMKFCAHTLPSVRACKTCMFFMHFYISFLINYLKIFTEWSNMPHLVFIDRETCTLEVPIWPQKCNCAVPAILQLLYGDKSCTLEICLSRRRALKNIVGIEDDRIAVYSDRERTIRNSVNTKYPVQSIGKDGKLAFIKPPLHCMWDSAVGRT